MGQVGLGDIFMNGQISNINTSHTIFTKEAGQKNGHTFSKELDKAKTLQSESKDKSDTPKIKDYGSKESAQQVTEEVKEKAKEEVESPQSFSEDEITIESEEKIENSIDQAELDENILLLLSQTLNVTIDELKKLLTQMEYVPSDLLKQENFGKFINEVYSQIKGEDLLMIENGVKNISTLFKQLQAMSDTTNHQNTTVIAPKQNNREININELAQNTVQSKQNLQNIEQIEQQINDKMMQNAPIQNATQNMSQINKFQDAEKLTNVLNPTAINDVNEVDIGMVVPIQNFSSTVHTQLWKPEGTTTVQVPQFIETNIVDQIDFKTLGITKEIRLQLSPKELGELSIKLIEENSTIVAHIKVDNEKAKQFMLNQLGDLKTALEERGLTVVDVKVDIHQDTRQSQMEQEKQKSSKRIQEIISKHLEEFEEEKESPEKTSDSEVDYMV